MEIRDLHKDIERYLLNDCYCQHEVYSFDGFYCQLFYEDQQCEKIGETTNLLACVAHPSNDFKAKPQIVLFFLDGDKCVDALRYDATENNLSITKDILTNGIKGRKFNFDEYVAGSTAKSIKEILSIADAIMFD